jgi:polyisoprenoid-binding protein YceI
MRIRSLLLPALAALFLASPASAQKKFENDGNHTFIGFKATTTLFDVEGWFDKYNLLIEGDPAKPEGAKIKLEIDAKSINTRNKTRDKDLREPAFFDVKKYPKIIFTGTKATKEGDKVIVEGTLEMHGVKKDVKIPFKQVIAKNGAGYEQVVHKAYIKINRKDYGIGTDSIAAKISLDDEVELKLLVAGFFK